MRTIAETRELCGGSETSDGLHGSFADLEEIDGALYLPGADEGGVYVDDLLVRPTDRGWQLSHRAPGSEIWLCDGEFAEWTELVRVVYELG